jgi:hypothetical protein
MTVKNFLYFNTLYSINGNICTLILYLRNKCNDELIMEKVAGIFNNTSKWGQINL